MKFSKIIITVLVLCMIVGLTSCASDSEAPEGMKNVAREENPFNFYVPQSWMTNSGDVIGAYYSSYDKSNISIMPYGGDFDTSEEYWNDFKTRSAEAFSEFEVLEENELAVVAKRNALQYTYKLTVDGESYQCQKTILSYGNLFYVITYTATVDNFDAHLTDVAAILAAFEFKQ